MTVHSVVRPIFFIGMPRSGTTIVFEAFARHPFLAWPTNYTQRYPESPELNLLRRLLDNRWVRLIGRKGQYAATRMGNRYLPQPNEAYRFWNRFAHPDFARSFLTDVLPADRDRARLQRAIGSLISWQGRSRFAAKLTGPPRIAFLSAVFPDAYFVHVVRDGRAVVHSLLRVDFWKNKGGLETPFWNGGPPNVWMEQWKRSGRDPGTLAAIQWRHVVGTARQEASRLAPNQYIELRYEDFVSAPASTLQRILSACGLDVPVEIQRYLDHSPALLNLNWKYRRDFTVDYTVALSESMKPELSLFGYDTDATSGTG